MSPGVAAGLEYREAPAEGDLRGTALLLHGYPQSSFMWEGVLPAVAGAGWRAVAPDLAGFGDSPPDTPGTWERHVEALERFRSALGLERIALVAHDWGGLIGLRWACEYPEAVRALVVSGTGFFTDGKWHGLAEALRTEGQGEQLVDGMTREAFGAMLAQASLGVTEAAVDHYFQAFETDDRRRAQLELYRSGDFEKLAPYEGCLGALGVPTLLLWGERDEFAPVASARRFEREISGSELIVLDGAGHFVWDDAPDRAGAALAAFLARI